MIGDGWLFKGKVRIFQLKTHFPNFKKNHLSSKISLYRVRLLGAISLTWLYDASARPKVEMNRFFSPLTTLKMLLKCLLTRKGYRQLSRRVFPTRADICSLDLTDSGSLKSCPYQSFYWWSDCGSTLTWFFTLSSSCEVLRAAGLSPSAVSFRCPASPWKSEIYGLTYLRQVSSKYLFMLLFTIYKYITFLCVWCLSSG